MTDKTIVLDRYCGFWRLTFGDGSTRQTSWSSAVKAGQASEWARQRHPGYRMGIKSAEFGPLTLMAYGPVVWLKD